MTPHSPPRSAPRPQSPPRSPPLPAPQTTDGPRALPLRPDAAGKGPAYSDSAFSGSDSTGPSSGDGDRCVDSPPARSGEDLRRMKRVLSGLHREHEAQKKLCVELETRLRNAETLIKRIVHAASRSRRASPGAPAAKADAAAPGRVADLPVYPAGVFRDGQAGLPVYPVPYFAVWAGGPHAGLANGTPVEEWSPGGRCRATAEEPHKRP